MGTRHRYDSPEPYEPPAPNAHNARKWDQLYRYQTALKAAVDAGQIHPSQAQWGDESISPPDLARMIQSARIPWSGPLPGQEQEGAGLPKRGNGAPGQAQPAAQSPTPLSADQASAVGQAARFPRNPLERAAQPPADPLLSQPGTGPMRLGFQAQAAANAASRAAYPQPPADFHFGKVFQQGAPVAPPTVNLGETAFFNGQPLGPGSTVTPINPKYGGGAAVAQTMSADAPSYTGGEKGKFVGPDEAARVARVGGAAGSLATATSPIPERPQLDEAAQKDIVAKYPEIGQAGSWANTNFVGSLKPGVNTAQEAMAALGKLTAPVQLATPLPPGLQTPTLPAPAFGDIKPGKPAALPPALANVPAQPFGLGLGAPTAAPSVNPLEPKPLSLAGGTTIKASELAAPAPSLFTRAAQAMGGLGGSQDISTDPTRQPRVGFNSGRSIVSAPPPISALRPAPAAQPLGNTPIAAPPPPNPFGPGSAQLGPDEEIGPDGKRRKKQQVAMAQ